MAAAKTRIMYIEFKGTGVTGPARIGRVSYSKTGRTLIYRGKTFKPFRGFKANYVEIDSGDEYWISGPRRDGVDGLYGRGQPVEIDEDVREEYWTDIRRVPECKDEKFT